MTRALAFIALAACGGAPTPAAGPRAPRATVLPAVLVADRFFIETRTRAGRPLRLYTDTGGGMFLFDTAVVRAGLPAGDTVKLDLAPDRAIPLPAGGLPVFPAGGGGPRTDFDGMLGEAWFAGRVWTFDYAGGRLLLREPGDLPQHDPAHRVPVGFASEKSLHFPRMHIAVDGQVIEVLLDTGAMVALSDDALAALGGGEQVRATSFITRTIFEGWRERHPSWRVVELADMNAQGEPMIEVPQVTVAGQTVGPVWFTRRADKNFREKMSQWMDRTIDGAFGGSGLRYFTVTIDYPNAFAIFERAR